MPTLGNCFPTASVEQYVARSLRPGCVIRIEVEFPQKTKPKFLLLVDDGDPEYLTFIINSETHAFIDGKEHLRQCQVDIDASSHPFLDHDSKIACHETLALKRSDVFKDLCSDTSKIKGCITADVKGQVIAAVKFAKTLSKAEKDSILASLAA